MTCRILSLFSGIGSTEIAFKELNEKHIVVGTSEVDKNAIKVYSALHHKNTKVSCDFDLSKDNLLNYVKSKNIFYNFSNGKSEIPRGINELTSAVISSLKMNNLGDISLLKTSDIPDCDFISYGFPCKNISVAGEQKGLKKNSGTQSSLLWECERIIKSKKPKYLLMENVKNLISKTHKPVFDEWISTLDTMGYNNYWEVLNAKDYGAPQNRERVMMVSIRKDIDKGNFKMPLTNGKNKSVIDIIEDSSVVDPSLYYDQANCPNILYEDREKTNKLMQVGNTGHRIHSNTRIYHYNGLSPTLNSMNGGKRQPKFLVDNIPRRATVLECWRIMGIPDRYFNLAKTSGVANSKLYERSGRSISIPMLVSIIEELFKSQK